MGSLILCSSDPEQLQGAWKKSDEDVRGFIPVRAQATELIPKAQSHPDLFGRRRAAKAENAGVFLGFIGDGESWA